MQKDYYSILGISPEASEEEVRSAFERLSSRLHNGYQAEEHLAELEEAYVVLSDPRSREEYNRLYKLFARTAKSYDGLDADRLGEVAISSELKLGKMSNIAPEAIDFELDLDDLDSPALNELINTLKSTIFNLINGQYEQKPHDGAGGHLGNANVYLDLALKPQERGYRFLDYFCYIQCSDCSGKGSRYGQPLIDCLACTKSSQKENCLVCAGVGKHPEENCPRCKGEGRVMAKRQIEVKIPKNVQHNAIIQVAGGGHHGFRGLKTGDLFIKVLLTKAEKR